MASFRDLLKATKAQIHEVDTAEAEERLKQAGTVALDVREVSEHDQGALVGAVHVVRGHLESQVDNKIPNLDTPVVVYCAGGTRSAFAARTLSELGYTNVVSMIGGFDKWKNESRLWETPKSLTADQRNRYSRHLLLPEVGDAGSKNF